MLQIYLYFAAFLLSAWIKELLEALFELFAYHLSLDFPPFKFFAINVSFLISPKGE